MHSGWQPFCLAVGHCSAVFEFDQVPGDRFTAFHILAACSVGVMSVALPFTANSFTGP